MLKDKIFESFDRIKYTVNKNSYEDPMDIKLRGYVEVTAKRKGVIIYHDEGPNKVTYAARHALMHMIRGSSFSPFGKTVVDASDLSLAISRRVQGLPRTSTINPDGTLVSGEGYFSEKNPFTSDGSDVGTQILTQNINLYGGDFDPSDAVYSNMPTKILFGTGVEFERMDITNKQSTKLSLVHRVLDSANRSSFLSNTDAITTLTEDDVDVDFLKPILDQFGIGGGDPIAGLETFNESMNPAVADILDYTNPLKVTDINNYSAIYKGTVASNAAVNMTSARTVNDVFSATIPNHPSLTSDPVLRKPISLNSNDIELSPSTPYYSPEKNNQSYAITGAVKTHVFQNTDSVLDTSKGMGVPCFVYIDPFAGKTNQAGTNTGISETVLDMNKANDKETKIVFTVVLPEQANENEFYPYNGYSLKEIGLYSDSFLVKKQDSYKVAPSAATFLGLTGANVLASDPVDGSAHIQMKSAFGTLWALRKIRPIFKDWDIEIEVRWTLYFDES